MRGRFEVLEAASSVGGCDMPGAFDFEEGVELVVGVEGSCDGTDPAAALDCPFALSSAPLLTIKNGLPDSLTVEGQHGHCPGSLQMVQR